MTTKLPSGPSGRLINTLHLLKDTIGAMRRWRDEYGDPFLTRSVNGQVFATGRPELIREILRLSDDDFTPFAMDGLAPVTGRASVLLTAGERHRRDRKLLMPPFHGERMRAYGQAMHELALARLEQVQVGVPFPMLQLGQSVALDVIVRVVFGVDDLARLSTYAEAMQRATEAVHPAWIFVPSLQRGFFGFGPFARFVRLRERARALLREQLELTRARGEGEDILSLLLKARYDDGEPMPDEEVIDQLITLLIAGHETTAISLSWAMYYVLSQPEVLARLKEELVGVSEPEEQARLPYLKAVCDEALRIHPIVPELMRTLKRPLQLGEYEVPAGMTVAASATLLHSNPDVYPQPEAFRPERFLEHTFRPEENLSFGGGTRRCIGAAFAHYEMRVVLATLLKAGSFELEDASRPRVVRRSLTLAPEGGVRLSWRPLTGEERLAA